MSAHEPHHTHRPDLFPPRPRRRRRGVYRVAHGQALAARGCDVVAFDNLSTGYRDAAPGGDPARLVGDSTIARRVPGWKPQLADLDTFIRHARQWECKACPATRLN